MKLWLDDQPELPTRTPPLGFLSVKTAKEAIRVLRSNQVTDISFDHDLGTILGSGYTVALWIEREAFKGTLPPIQWGIHSANPVGQERIRRCMEQAERFWCRTFR